MKREMTITIIISWIFISLCTVPFVTAAEIDENTVALWLFDEGSGDVVKDSSTNGNDGKMFEAEWTNGIFGDALKFDGIAGKADYVEVSGSASLEIAEALTIEVWVNIEQHQDDHIRIVCAYDAAVTKGYSLLLSNAGEVKTFLNIAGGWSIHTGQAIPEGEYQTLCKWRSVLRGSCSR